MADNGQEQSGNERLDRMEATLNLLINDHVQFREKHKMLLQSQVLMSGSLESLRDSLAALTGRVDALTARVDATSASVAALTANVEAMRANFDARLKRLES
jgi:hypothetical protein